MRELAESTRHTTADQAMRAIAFFMFSPLSLMIAEKYLVGKRVSSQNPFLTGLLTSSFRTPG
jgi:hypothetical protein